MGHGSARGVLGHPLPVGVVHQFHYPRPGLGPGHPPGGVPGVIGGHAMGVGDLRAVARRVVGVGGDPVDYLRGGPAVGVAVGVGGDRPAGVVDDPVSGEIRTAYFYLLAREHRPSTYCWKGQTKPSKKCTHLFTIFKTPQINELRPYRANREFWIVGHIKL